MDQMLEPLLTLKSDIGSGAEEFSGSVIAHVELQDQVQVRYRLQDVFMQGRRSRQLVNANPVLSRATRGVLSIQLLTKQSKPHISSVSM